MYNNNKYSFSQKCHNDWCDVECNPCKCFSYSAVVSVGLLKSQTSFLNHVDKCVNIGKFSLARFRGNYQEIIE